MQTGSGTLADVLIVGVFVAAALAFLYFKVWRRTRVGRCAACNARTGCRAAPEVPIKRAAVPAAGDKHSARP